MESNMQKTVQVVAEEWSFQGWLAGHVKVMESWTADETRAKFAEFLANRGGIEADLKARTVDKLRNISTNMGDWHARGRKKAELVEEIVERMARQYVPGTLSYHAFTIGSGEKGKTMLEAVQERLAALTDAELAKHRAEVTQRRAERAKTYNNPETVEEFQAFLRVRGAEALTPEQAERWDALQATTRRAKAAKEAATVPALHPSQGVDVELKGGWHAKKGVKTYVAVLNTRVERDQYEQILGQAKRFGGYYSSFRGNGAVPGFQFESQGAAEQFKASLRGSVDVSAQVEAEDIQRTGLAADRLAESAARFQAKAEEDLNRDRQDNTARRARMAANAEAVARGRLALAGTMQRLAEAMRAGQIQHLGEVRHGTQVEALEGILRRARWARLRAAGKSHDEDLGPYGKEDVLHAEYPWPYVHKSTVSDGIRVLRDQPGAVRLCQELTKQMAATGDDTWGWHVQSHEGVERVQLFAGRAKSAGVRIDSLAFNLAQYKRIHAADIQSVAELRAALREYLTLRKPAAVEDPIKKAERELIGVKLPGFFPTPPAIVQRLIEAACIQDDHVVLEPSAGKGDILDAVEESYPGTTRHAVESSSSLRRILELKGHDIVGHDFLEYEATVQYDRVVMNPPFEDGQDITHVQRAFTLLKPGGRLAAIMSEGPFFRSDAKSVAFREWLDQHGDSEQLPEGSFAGADAFRQTGVATRLVVIKKEN